MKGIAFKLIAAPFVFGLIFIAYSYHAVKRTVLFVKYGGELNLYDKNEIKTIGDIYQLLKNNTVETSKPISNTEC